MGRQVTGSLVPLLKAGTLRDYFAAKAMQAMISTADGPCFFGLDGVETHTAGAAYAVADAMLAARSA